MVSDFHLPKRWMVLGLTLAQRKAMALLVWRDWAVILAGVNPTDSPTIVVALHRVSVMSCDRTLCRQLVSW